jgi:leucyl aminopeptidase
VNVRFVSEPLTSVKADLLAVAVPSSMDGAIRELDEALGKQLLGELESRKFKGGAGSAVAVPTLGRLPSRTVLAVGVGDGSFPSLAKAAARAGREARALSARSLALAFATNGDPHVASRLVEEAFNGNYAYQVYKPEDERSPALETVTLIGAPGGKGGARASAVRLKWQTWTRDLVNAPAADIYPEALAAKARELAALPHVEVEVWDADRCRAEGCAGIVAVGQGSDRAPCLIHVRYAPPDPKERVALVGKGVTFDSGGYSLKPTDGMLTMRCDMGGAATMLAATGAAAELGLPIAVDCFVGAVENLISGKAYKLGDILRYSNGVTVEIHNTDAEGRLVLADCLIRASEVPGVTAIVDAATLTGACVVALGDDYAGLFTTNDALAGEIESAAAHCAEHVWRLPMHAPYKDLLKSDYAQIKNVGGRSAGAVTAALFLEHFVKDSIAWAHLDIAGPAFREKANGRSAAGGTGELVRTVLRFLEVRAGRGD